MLVRLDRLSHCSSSRRKNSVRSLARGWAAGKSKRQGGERVHHTEVAHLLAVDGLYPDDADDDLGGHTVFLLGAGQGVAVFCQNRTPARIRMGSMKRLRYTRQFLAVPLAAAA